MTVRAVYRDTDPSIVGGGPRELDGFELEREAEWNDQDLALLIALAEIRAEEAAAAVEYGAHGRPLDEATSKWADPARRREGYHYEHRVRVDHAQRYLNTAKRERAAAYPDEDADSLIWTLVRIEDGPIPADPLSP